LKITARKSATYTPTWNGNRDLPEDEQVMVEIVFPTQGDREDLQPHAVRDGEDIIIKHNNTKAVRKHVKSIINLSEEVDGNERKIETGVQLVESTSSEILELVVELGAVILRNFGLDADEKKSLK
jgi:hypothetical protein